MNRMVVFALVGMLWAGVARAADDVAGTPIDFNTKGGWCWFQDERAIVDNGKLIFGTVDSPSGDVNVTQYDFATKTARTVTLHEKFQSDDHDVPALLKLLDGRYLAKYASHGGGGGRKGTDLMRWRITKRPGDISEWEPEQTLPVGASVSYMNVYRLSAENNRIYNFHRGVGWNPNYLVSDDDGRTFRYGGRLLSWTSRSNLRGGGRPYVRYTSNNVDTIHFIATDDHPRNYDNSIYHAFIRGGKVHRSDGSVLGPLSTTKETTISPTDLTCVFRGNADAVAWTTDIRLDSAGNPYIAFSVQVGDSAFKGDDARGGEDLRYHYARWDGKKWQEQQIAYAGTRLYAPEVDYSGLVALHPGNPDVLYLSSNADPATGKPLISKADNQRHREIFKGVTSDGGKTWKWTAITSNSTADNIRPIARVVDGKTAVVIWQRGTYRTYTSYDMKVVGTLD